MEASQQNGPDGERMRICVIGCGAVGSLFAAHLGQLGEVETWAYDLDLAHVDAINANGLRLTGVGEVTGRVHATADAASIPPCRFGVIATKAIHTKSAMEAVGHAFAEGSVCSVQNGVGNEELIAEQVERVILGTTFPAGRVLEPGLVAWDTAGETSIGPFEPAPPPMAEVELLADVLTRSGMTTRALPDARGAQWTKVIFNAASNPLGALTGLTHGRLCDDPALRALVRKLVDEGKAVAAALGVTLDSDPDALIDHAHKVAYDHRASMLQDIEAKRPTEIEFLNGGIARFGAEKGVATPLNETIATLLKGVEVSWT
ncbi:MAG: ketopantoate reductase family protein [Solirubrobacterales bacterium]